MAGQRLPSRSGVTGPHLPIEQGGASLAGVDDFVTPALDTVGLTKLFGPGGPDSAHQPVLTEPEPPRELGLRLPPVGGFPPWPSRNAGDTL
jgi:hypothetical protein